MIDWMLSKPAVISLAVIGGAFSLAATILRQGQERAQWTKRMNAAAYVFMGASILLFIIIGLRGTGS